MRKRVDGMKKIVIMTLVFMILLGVSAQPKAISNLQNDTAAKEPEKYPVTLSAKQQDLIVGDKWEFTIQAAKKSDLEGKSLYIDLPDQFKLDIDKTVKANKWDDTAKRGYSAKENKLILNEQMQAKLADAIVVYGEIVQPGSLIIKVETDKKKIVSNRITIYVGTESTEQNDSAPVAKAKKVVSKSEVIKPLAAPNQSYTGGVRLNDQMTVGTLDFSKLDDSPEERKNYKEQKTFNEPIPMKTSETLREYYHYFYPINDRNTTYEEFRNGMIKEGGRIYAPSAFTKLSDLIYKVGLNSHSIVTLQKNIPKDKLGAPITYISRRDSAPGGWEVGFGETASEEGQSIDVENVNQNSFNKSTSFMPLVKLYTNAETGETLAYAPVIHRIPGIIPSLFTPKLVGLARLKVSPVGTEGRQNINFRYQRITDTKDNWSYTNLFYKVHMDIAGRHRESKMFSQGKEKGIYFKEMNMLDGQDYYLYFHRKGYEKGPAAFRASNNPGLAFEKQNFNTLDAASMADPGKDQQLPFTQHPAWGFRWEPQIQKGGEVREGAYEIDVKSTPPANPSIEITKNQYKDDQYLIEGTWMDPDSDKVTLYYTIDDDTPQEIETYSNPNPNEQQPYQIEIPANKLKNGMDHSIKIYVVNKDNLTSNIEEIMLSPESMVKEEIVNDTGSVLKNVSPGETIFYRINVSTGYSEQDKEKIKMGEITQSYSDLLAPPENMQAVDQAGNKIGEVTYEDVTKKLRVKLSADLPRYTPIAIQYRAKIKEDTPRGSFIKSRSTFQATYSTDKEVEAISDDTRLLVDGVLKFESVPENFSFGTQLINTKTELFPLQEYEPALTIKDTRGDSNRWKLNVSISQTITGQKTGQELHGLLYLKGKHKQEISAVPQTIETGEEGLAKVSQEWNEKDNGFFLEVPPGVAKSDRYQGEIQWELQDAP